jgi:WD40 repeat protein
MLIDLKTAAPRLVMSGHTELVTDLAFSPDGLRLVSAGHDRTVRIWNVVNGQELLTLEGHTGPVRALAFAPDGRTLASCADGPDGAVEVIVWRTFRD